MIDGKGNEIISCNSFSSCCGLYRSLKVSALHVLCTGSLLVLGSHMVYTEVFFMYYDDEYEPC